MAGKKGKNTAAKKEAKKQRTQEKETKKASKAGKALFGSDDIDAILADFAVLDKKRTTVTSTPCEIPSPRVNASFVAHPTKDELILFGGEHFNGRKVVTYADLFVYNISKSEWRLVSIPSTPPPRTSHQAVVVPTATGAHMYVFGGDFTSPSQLFRHYNDLWVLDLSTYTWEQIKAPNGPSARSGHRMIYFKRKLYVFGGFFDNHQDIKYFDDMYVFDLDTRQWTAIKPANKSIPWPAQRSGFGFITHEGANTAIMCGGYSTQLKKKGQLDEKSNVLSDMWAFDFAKQTWSTLKNGGDSLPSRSGMSLFTAKNKIFAFGGVKDIEGGDDDDIDSTFFNDTRSYFLKKRAWELTNLNVGRDPTKKISDEMVDDVESKKKETKETKESREEALLKNSSSWKWNAEAEAEADAKKSKKKDQDEDDGDAIDELLLDLELEDDEEEADDNALVNVKKRTGYVWPRRNAMICVRNSIAYMFGGVFERGACEVTLNDLHYCDTRRGKLTTWYTLADADMSKQEWYHEEDDDDDDDDDDEDDEDEEEEKPAPLRRRRHEEVDDNEDQESEEDEDEDVSSTEPLKGEALQAFFARTKDHWMSEAHEDGVSEKEIRKTAFDMAKLQYTLSSMNDDDDEE